LALKYKKKITDFGWYDFQNGTEKHGVSGAERRE